MCSEDCKEQDKQIENTIIYYKDKEWFFSIKTDDGRIEDFVIESDKSGHKWTELYGDFDDFTALKLAISQEPTSRVVEDDAEDFIKYVCGKCEFYLLYIRYVDYLIRDWDGDPFIEFGFVEIGHQDFEIYAKEALRLSEFLRNRRINKRRTKE